MGQAIPSKHGNPPWNIFIDLYAERVTSYTLDKHKASFGTRNEKNVIQASSTGR